VADATSAASTLLQTRPPLLIELAISFGFEQPLLLVGIDGNICEGTAPPLLLAGILELESERHPPQNDDDVTVPKYTINSPP
jgi:hypothetical protein